MGRLSNKVAVITGATSGIGEGTARHFVREGAKVVLSGRNSAKGEALAKELGVAAAFVRADVTSEDDIAHLIDATVSKFGRIDCMFNNAGETKTFLPVADVTVEDLDLNFRTLVHSVALGSKYAVRQFRAQGGGGVVINNASVAATRTGYGSHVYSAVKAAVIQLTRSYAMETAPEGIRFNSISPGAILTPIFARAFGASNEDADAKTPGLAAAFASVTPLGRTGLPADIAAAAVFLASDEAGFITAQDIVVDSGITAGRTYREAVDGFGGLADALHLPRLNASP